LYLKDNYRSSSGIVETNNFIFSKLLGSRFGEGQVVKNNESSKLNFHIAGNDLIESDYIVHQVKHYLQDDNINDIAVLLRTLTNVSSLMEKLMSQNISFKMQLNLGSSDHPILFITKNFLLGIKSTQK